MLLVASCAFPEEKHFALLEATFKHLAVEFNTQYLGEILKPSSSLFKTKGMETKTTAYFNDLRTASQQLTLQDKIDHDLANQPRQS